LLLSPPSFSPSNPAKSSSKSSSYLDGHESSLNASYPSLKSYIISAYASVHPEPQLIEPDLFR